MDVAWSKIWADKNGLTVEQINEVIEELSNGLGLDHPHVIKTYRCWVDTEAQCINSVTEFFTSGNLRDYCQKFRKTLDIKAVKKWGRQILQGLSYLHHLSPPVVHGDLRADKIYINGYNGEIKIGDLGLSVLVPKRFEPGVMPEGDPSDHYTEVVDIFAFGLVMLELVSRRPIDRNSTSWKQILNNVSDPTARDFIRKCLSPAGLRPQATDLLREPFLQSSRQSTQSQVPPGDSQKLHDRNKNESRKDDHLNSYNVGQLQSQAVQTDFLAGNLSPTRQSSEEQQKTRVECEAGSIRGEDYFFQFTGKIKEAKLHFRLHMQYEGEEHEHLSGTSKTIDFVYDPEEDTPDEIAAEISSEFNLSLTDKDICAAALKEWLADQGPDPQR